MVVAGDRVLGARYISGMIAPSALQDHHRSIRLHSERNGRDDQRAHGAEHVGRLLRQRYRRRGRRRRRDAGPGSDSRPEGLRANGIDVVAIHHHMTATNPDVYFLHYWGKGSAQKLASGGESRRGSIGKAARLRPVDLGDRLTRSILGGPVDRIDHEKVHDRAIGLYFQSELLLQRRNQRRRRPVLAPRLRPCIRAEQLRHRKIRDDQSSARLHADGLLEALGRVPAD
jgi:hypothetical protein